MTTDAFSSKSEFGRRRKMNFCEENFSKKGKRRTLARSLSFSLSVSFTQNRDEKEEEQEDGEEVAIARRKKE